ncbi:MAG TPA: PIN domain-containing protein [Pyrinomonadaceae bacterium]|nr:PIN domain-containing protein [Pyrinomonadaceae bacterium]
MGTLIDTNVLVAAERGSTDLETIAKTYDDDVYISVITVSEMLHGMHRATSRPIRERRSRFIFGLLDLIPLVTIDLEVAREHARIWATLAEKGNMIGMNDAWLAATCIANGFAIATSNIREFERVPKLQIAAWSVT